MEPVETFESTPSTSTEISPYNDVESDHNCKEEIDHIYGGFGICSLCFTPVQIDDSITKCIVCSENVTIDCPYLLGDGFYHWKCENLILDKKIPCSCGKDPIVLNKVYDRYLDYKIVRMIYCKDCIPSRIKWILHEKSRGIFKSICYYCEKLIDKPKVCLGCKLVTYCSQKCQKCHWQCHKNYCGK